MAAAVRADDVAEAGEELLGTHPLGSRRLVISVHRTFAEVDEAVPFTLALHNDMSHELSAGGGHAAGYVPLSAVELCARDARGEVEIEAVGARPGRPHRVRFGRPSPAVRLHARAAGALSSASPPLTVTPAGGGRGAAAGAARAPAGADQQLCSRTLELGGGLPPLELYESRAGVHTQPWDCGLALALTLARAPHLAAGAAAPQLGAEGEGRAEGERLLPLRGVRALELGAGTGACALALAALGAHVTATDAEPSALELVRTNARANGLGARVSTAVVRWGEDCDALRVPYDLVVGADVAYAECAFAPLVATVRAVLLRSAPRRAPATAHAPPLSAAADAPPAADADADATCLLAYRRRCEAPSEAHFFHLLARALHVQELPRGALGYGCRLFRLRARARARAARGGGAGGAADASAGCRYCDWLCADHARRFVRERAAAEGAAGAGEGGDGGAGHGGAWSPALSGLLTLDS